MKEIIKKMYEKVKEGKKIVFLFVLNSDGSSPGRKGFHMIVDSEGDMDGSIGGGFMEHKLIELSKKILLEGRFTPFVKHQIHQADIDKNKSGMICSGHQTIAFYYFDKEDAAHLHVLTTENRLLLNEKGIASLHADSAEKVEIDLESERWEYILDMNTGPEIYILGGGHVGLALSRVMKQLGFYVHVFDDREGLNTLENNVYADVKKVISYEDAASYIPASEEVYVVLVSFGFRTDEMCMRQLLGKKFKYFGVMGSEAKMEKLIQNLLDDGYLQDDIDQVHTPIGLPIHSKTPEEIAISIAAEIISIKNK